MAWSRRAASAAVDATIRVAGRRQVVRAARLTLNRARLDIPNDIADNGEAMLQQAVLERSQSSETVVMDVGANQGQWSTSLLAAVARTGVRHVRVHAFEPSAHTAQLLREALVGQPVVVNQLALSDAEGVAELQVVAPGAGINSMYAQVDAPPVAVEQVSVSTVDEYCRTQGIEHVSLLKIDTEGHDMAVMSGAAEMLAEGRIDAVQFEYNHRWILARRFLKDAFDLMGPLGYALGKLTPVGVEAYPDGWDWELESFVEGNYVAWRTEVLTLPQVRWWKS